MEEEFCKLRWNSDDEENSNLHECYLKEHSSTYKILHGTLHKVFSSDSEAEHDKTAQNASGKTSKKKICKFFIPGYFDEKKIKFTKLSALKKSQQEVYLNVMIKYASKQSQLVTTSELSEYELLHEKVKFENCAFNQFVKQRCALSQDRYKLCNPDVKKYVEELWQHRLALISHYPARYEPLRMLPLVYSDKRRPVVMKMERILLQLGCVPYVIWPKFDKCVNVVTDYARIVMNYPPDGRHPEHADAKLHKEQVSKDKNAEKLAVNNGADIVISSNTLKNIADNHGPSFERSWDIPLSVRACIDTVTGASRKVVFVDKPLPPLTLTTAEKNLWYYRIAVKPLLCHKKHPKFLLLTPLQQYEQKCMTDTEGKDMSESEGKSPSSSLKRKHSVLHTDESDTTDNDGKLLIDLSDSDKSPTQTMMTRSRTRLISNSETNSESQNRKTTPKYNKAQSLKNLNISGTDIKQEPMETDSKWNLPPARSNVSYSMWRMHKDDFGKDNMKESYLKGDNTNREIKLIVRSKVDGYQCVNDKVYVVPKMEYQAEFGAECLTKSEISQQWMSLYVRPETALCRVRANICTSEVIMIEKRSLQEVVQESVQLLNGPINSLLGTVYNVLVGLVDLETGSYLLSHTPRLGAFVNLRYSNGSGRYDLHEMYSRVDPYAEPVNDIFVWNPIDPAIITPYHRAMNRVPATFPPILYVRGKKIKKRSKKKKKKLNTQ